MVSYSANGTVSVRPYVTVEGQGKTPIAAQASDGQWRRLQVLVVALCFLLNMLDGMDVLILSYIAPALSADWHVTPDRLGVLVSAGLAGMAAGGLWLAPMADRFGRRRLILTALVLMATAMFASVFCRNLGEMLVARFVVGIGIGSVLASMAALTAEYAPAKYRTFAVGFLQAGYPVGATITGFVVAQHLSTHGWQTMLLGAAILCAIVLPLAFVLLPESITFLATRQPKGALKSINRQLAALGEPMLDTLPPPPAHANDRPGLRALMADGRATGTVLLWAAIILCFMTLYFVISWIPKLSIEAGLSPKDGIYAGAIYNIGAFVGTSSVGLVAMRFDLRRVIFTYMALAATALLVFGTVHMPLALTLTTAFLIGVFVQGGFNGCYPLAAHFYPPHVRSAGIGWAMGMGRIGAVVGPLLGGFLLASKVSLPIIFGIFATPVVVGGLLITMIRPAKRPCQTPPTHPTDTQGPFMNTASSAGAHAPVATYLCGLLGSGIGGSRSPFMHETEARALGLPLVYRILDGEVMGYGEADLPRLIPLLGHMGFTGVNVTHPFKQAVLPLVDRLSDAARALGAINTIVWGPDGLLGDNTDWSGYRAHFLDGLGDKPRDRVALIGAGGAAAAVGFAHLDLGACELRIHDQALSRAQTLADRLSTLFPKARITACDTAAMAIAGADGVAQTSPVGMLGLPGVPFDADVLEPSMWVSDIIYFPERTRLLDLAAARGCATLGGSGMAVLQAAHAFTLFTGHQPDIARMMRAFNDKP